MLSLYKKRKTSSFPGFKLRILGVFLSITLCLSGCKDFVEIDSPRNLLDTSKVFESTATVESALANIYTNLRDQGLLNTPLGLNTLMGIYSDELDYLLNNLSYVDFEQHTIIPDNPRIQAWWATAYNTIYAANDIIEGVESSTAIAEEEKAPLIGQALFIRAYIHSLLVNLFGDIPLITTTNYPENNVVERTSEPEVYTQIITDLKEAVKRLPIRDPGAERVIPDKTTAQALLARVYLYTKDWEAAAEAATQVIQTPGYTLETDPAKVFLKESSEAIWQFKPDRIFNENALEANWFIINSVSTQRYALTDELVEAFEPGDLRKQAWVGEFIDPDTGESTFFPYKYTKDFNTHEAVEYSILFRLSEQYLIRAEARAQLGQLAEAQTDLNVVRHRAGLPDTTANTPENLLTAILLERQVELFTEYGQRWFDLKRTGKAEEVLTPLKPNWAATDLLLPLPENELETNPNLQPQNNGY